MAKSKHIGARFGNLTVVDVHHTYKTARTGAFVQVMLTRCDCGEVRQVRMASLTSGQAKACKSCARPSYRVSHKHPLYRRWRAMLERCSNPKSKHYQRYGGRGITVCDRWAVPTLEGLSNFLDDMGECPPGMTIERKDNDGPYSPDNCRWATNLEQQNNKSSTVSVTVDDRTMSVCDWARELGVSESKIYYPLRWGHSLERIVTELKNSPRRKVRWFDLDT